MPIVVGMELLGERPVWSMSGSEMAAGLDHIGYADQIGAHDTARFLEFRYRLNGVDARRDVRLARALPKYPTVSEALAQHDIDDDDDATDDAGEPGDATAPDANLG